MKAWITSSGTLHAVKGQKFVVTDGNQPNAISSRWIRTGDGCAQ